MAYDYCTVAYTVCLANEADYDRTKSWGHDLENSLKIGVTAEKLEFWKHLCFETIEPFIITCQLTPKAVNQITWADVQNYLGKRLGEPFIYFNIESDLKKVVFYP